MRTVIKDNMIQGLIVCLALFTNLQCKEHHSPDAFYKEVTQSGSFNKEVTIGEMQYAFKIRPAEFVALHDALSGDKKHVDKKVYQERLGELKDCIVLLIEQRVISGNSSPLKYKMSGGGDYEQRLMYYQTQAANDLLMICNTDTMKPLSYIYENNMDISPVNTIVAIFQQCGSNTSEVKFQFNDRVFDNYYINKSFSLKELADLPKIKL